MVNKKFLGNCGVVSLVWFGIASSCFGAGVSCNISTNNSIAAAGSAIAGQPIAADPTAPNSSDSFATLGAAGCFTTDVQFSNFVVTSGGIGSPTNLNYISTLTNQDLTLTNPLTAVISSIRGTETGTNSPDGQQDDAVNNFVATASTSTTLNSRYEFAESSGSPVRYFTFTILGEQLGAGTIPGTITGDVFLCLGANFTGSASGTCGGTLQTIALTSATNYNIQLTTPQTTIGILNSFALNGGNGAGNAAATFITSFEETFEDTPEPSTFLLFGTALAGISALRFRKRKQRS